MEAYSENKSNHIPTLTFDLYTEIFRSICSEIKLYYISKKLFVQILPFLVKKISVKRFHSLHEALHATVIRVS